MQSTASVSFETKNLQEYKLSKILFRLITFSVLALSLVLPSAAHAATVMQGESFTVDYAPAVNSPLVLNPMGDTWVTTATAGNFGSDPTLRVNASPLERAYMAFDLSSVPNSIVSAKLGMGVADATTGTVNIAQASDFFSLNGYKPWYANPWWESQMVFSNSPGPSYNLGPVPLAGSQAPAGTWVEVNTTSFAQANVGSHLGIYMDTASADRFQLYSRNSPYRPQLALTFGGSATPLIYPTSTPGTYGGAVMKFYGNGSINKQFTNTETVNSLVINAQQDACQGNAMLVITIDGKRLESMPFMRYSSTPGSYAAYAMPIGFSIPPGSHNIKMSFTNDLYVSGSCDRNLMVDQVALQYEPSYP